MVVDDSVVVRGLLARWVDQEPDLRVVASVHTGSEAVDKLDRVNPDVVILDIEMPEMDGLTALPLLLSKKRDLVVIMVSALTRRHAEASLKALALGASDYISKPQSNRDITTSTTFRQELIEKIRQIGGRRRHGHKPASVPGPALARPATTVVLDPRSRVNSAINVPGPVRKNPLRAPAALAPRALVIGASTGGPQALTTVMFELRASIEHVPVLIVQHMPPTFTTIFAEHLARACERRAREPEDGERVVDGTVYVAPGGRHMRVEREGGHAVVRLDDGPAINFCKPAVDPLFTSACRVWGGATLAVILTGMGHDGTEGARAVAAAGGTVIAQDEATSVVWGMPGSAVHAGVCSAVLPLPEIAPRVARLFAGEAA